MGFGRKFTYHLLKTASVTKVISPYIFIIFLLLACAGINFNFRAIKTLVNRAPPPPPSSNLRRLKIAVSQKRSPLLLLLYCNSVQNTPSL